MPLFLIIVRVFIIATIRGCVATIATIFSRAILG